MASYIPKFIFSYLVFPYKNAHLVQSIKTISYSVGAKIDIKHKVIEEKNNFKKISISGNDKMMTRKKKVKKKSSTYCQFYFFIIDLICT